LAYIEVISALVFGVLFLGEVVTLNLFIGGILIVGSTLLLKTE